MTSARDPAFTHLPGLEAFNRAIGDQGDVGIWPETYTVAPDGIESVYRNMLPHGLGAAMGRRKSKHAPARAGDNLANGCVTRSGESVAIDPQL